MRPHAEFLYRLAWRFTGNAADAEDLVQDVLLKLYPRMAELCAVERLRPWLAKVLYRQFVDFSRRRARSPFIEVAGDAESEETLLDRLAAVDQNPEEHAERRQLYERIERALEQLNSEQRAVVTLHDVEGYSLEELATILEAPLGTLKSRLHRARQRLRVLLGMEPFSAAERVNG
jgi:RNA polymerase sigma factor (sigma-70 family)